jgi:hypothetical protein
MSENVFCPMMNWAMQYNHSQLGDVPAALCPYLPTFAFWRSASVRCPTSFARRSGAEVQSLDTWFDRAFEAPDLQAVFAD